MTPKTFSTEELTSLKTKMKLWASELGFSMIGIADTELSQAETRLIQWLADGRHGDMHYMAKHGDRRTKPAAIQPGTVRVVSVRMDYLPDSATPPTTILQDSTKGYVSRYALGRDYHRLIRRRLQKLADLMSEAVGPFRYRAFVDSGPVMEKPLAVKAGLGWLGKHTNLIDKDAGSFFFLGELYTDLPLPLDEEQTDHCGDCSRCMTACPTGAIDKAYQLDARRCIAYLTIELKGSIPEAIRPLIGNRIFGCDDCQLVCPWIRFSKSVSTPDFQPRHSLDNATLASLFSWSESEFNTRLEGSPIRRIGYQRWLRNIAVALGNSSRTTEVLVVLEGKKAVASPMVREHIEWAIARLNDRAAEVD